MYEGCAQKCEYFMMTVSGVVFCIRDSSVESDKGSADTILSLPSSVISERIEGELGMSSCILLELLSLSYLARFGVELTLQSLISLSPSSLVSLVFRTILSSYFIVELNRLFAGSALGEVVATWHNFRESSEIIVKRWLSHEAEDGLLGHSASETPSLISGEDNFSSALGQAD